MNMINTAIRISLGTIAGLSLLSGVALADMSNSDDVAAELEQAISLMPEYDGSGTIMVTSVDGKVVLSGLTDSDEQLNEIDQMLQGMDGLDMGMVQNDIIRQ